MRYLFLAILLVGCSDPTEELSVKRISYRCNFINSMGIWGSAVIDAYSKEAAITGSEKFMKELAKTFKYISNTKVECVPQSEYE